MNTKIILLLFSLFCVNLFSQDKFTSEDILILNDSIKLPGTLTYTKTSKKQPLLIFVNGSGNPDRNGNQPLYGVNGNYIKQFAHAMSNNEVAFFRFDKRNVTKDNAKYILKSYKFSDLVDDVSSVINYFKDDKRFNEIILIGHSQGSLVAMMAANKYVNKYISLAGLGESADKTLVKQITLQSKEFGEITKQHLEELKLTGTIKEINPQLIALFAKQNHEFLISYIKLNPQEEISKLKIPVLIINGTKDIQVKEEDAKNLHKANSKSKLVIIENMNHVLKTIIKDEDNLVSYSSPDFPLSEELVSSVLNFIKE